MLAKGTQEDRWPSKTGNAGYSLVSFPGGMAAVELENMVFIPGFQRLLVGLMIK